MFLMSNYNCLHVIYMKSVWLLKVLDNTCVHNNQLLHKYHVAMVTLIQISTPSNVVAMGPYLSYNQ